jgi:hypothetical protein
MHLEFAEMVELKTHDNKHLVILLNYQQELQVKPAICDLLLIVPEYIRYLTCFISISSFSVSELQD